jgi:hypothetical protein
MFVNELMNIPVLTILKILSFSISLKRLAIYGEKEPPFKKGGTLF